MTALLRVMTATDLSSPARYAVDRGFQMTANTQAKYSLVYALELDSLNVMREWMGEDLSLIKNKLGEEARSGLEQLAIDGEKHRGIKADIEVINGPHLAVISSYAEQSNTELLIIGEHGQNFIRHHLLGSTASKLITKSFRYPVLVVKQAPKSAYTQILIPVDFSIASEAAIKFSQRIAPDAHIILLHVFEVPFEGKMTYAGVDANIIQQYRTSTHDSALVKINAIADSAGLNTKDYTPLIVHGDPAHTVIDQQLALNVDLIVIGKHGKNFTEELLLGSVTKYVLNTSKCDVLVINGRSGAKVT